MKQKNIITNQRVRDLKIHISRNLRKKMTRAEFAFWEMVKNKKLFNLKFRRQQIIDGLIVDFYCNEIGLVIEIDGSIHEIDEQKYIDTQRTKILETRKLKVLRFSNDEVINNTDYIIEKIKSIL
jgi:very-short-patch-repair endonuclease